MKASEFRVGNIVFDYDGKPTDLAAVEILAMTQCEIANTPIEFIKPIPLTEEWLKRFGFEKYTPTNWIFRKHINALPDITINQFSETLFTDDKYGSILRNVNDLQNLYYAIYKKELELKQ